MVARYRTPTAFVELLDAKLRADGVVQIFAEDEKNRTVVNIYAPEGASTIAGPKQEVERDQWVTVHGKVVGEPNLARTPSGKSYQYALLATEVEGKVVEWHRVKFWNERAEKIYRQLSRGGEVTVGGYQKEEERYDPRTRQTRTERYIHGVKVES